MKVHLLSWPESVYEGLSRFHAAKGFDPNGQDLARHLGQPLYEISASSRIATACSEYLSVILACLTEMAKCIVEELSSEAYDNENSTPGHRVLTRFILVGAIGLILALLVSWMHRH
jgi:hypothetical protein